MREKEAFEKQREIKKKLEEKEKDRVFQELYKQEQERRRQQQEFEDMKAELY